MKSAEEFETRLAALMLLLQIVSNITTQEQLAFIDTNLKYFPDSNDANTIVTELQKKIKEFETLSKDDALFINARNRKTAVFKQMKWYGAVGPSQRSKQLQEILAEAQLWFEKNKAQKEKGCVVL